MFRAIASERRKLKAQSTSIRILSNQPWSVFIQKTVQIPTTGSGSIVAFVLLNGNFVAQTNPIPLNFTGQPPQASVAITTPVAGRPTGRDSRVRDATT